MDSGDFLVTAGFADTVPGAGGGGSLGFDRSADFDGLGSVGLDLASGNGGIDPGGADWTICFWMRPTFLGGASNNRAVVSKGVNTAVAATLQYGFEVSQTFDRIQCYVSDGSTVFQILSVNSSLANDTWYFVTATYDVSETTLSLAIDNGTPVTDATVEAMHTLDTDFRIGYTFTAGNDPWIGQVCGFGVWNRILSGAELISIYNSGVGKQASSLTGGEQSNLISYHNLDEVSTGVAAVPRLLSGGSISDADLEDSDQVPSTVEVPS